MTPEEAYWKALNRPRKTFTRTREIEDIILTDPIFAYLYACDILRDRWKKAEHIIATDPESAFCYAKDVIKGRWIEAEDVIASSNKHNQMYLLDMFDNDPPADYASKSSLGLYFYAKNVLKGRLPTELHNKMLCFAIIEPDTKHIKTYFKSKKYQ